MNLTKFIMWTYGLEIQNGRSAAAAAAAPSPDGRVPTFAVQVNVVLMGEKVLAARSSVPGLAIVFATEFNIRNETDLLLLSILPRGAVRCPMKQTSANF
jgi:hypothetical protein